jgi:hypothetical protein
LLVSIIATAEMLLLLDRQWHICAMQPDPVGEARRDALHPSFALSYGRAMLDRLFALQRVLTLASIVLAVACGPTDEAVKDATWVGTITTKDGVSTVYNESGSVWSGNATVIEEASIGVEAGPDELMFGDVVWLYEAGGTIYVVDVQVPAVRTFDLDGNVLVVGVGSRVASASLQSPLQLLVQPAVESDRPELLHLFAPFLGLLQEPVDLGIRCFHRSTSWRHAWITNAAFSHVVGPTGRPDPLEIEAEQTGRSRRVPPRRAIAQR